MGKSKWIIAIIVIELFIFARYQAHDAHIHFFLHSLVAVSVVFAVATLCVLLGKKPPSLVYAVFLLHQYAMFPDYLYSLGYPHQPWMNIFLAHLWLDDLPLHEVILPTVSFLAVVGYFVAKKRYILITNS